MSEEKETKQESEDVSAEEMKEIAKAHYDVVYSGQRKALVRAILGIMDSDEDMERFADAIARHFGED